MDQLTLTSEEKLRVVDHYPEFLKSIQNHFDSVLASGNPLFRVNIGNLFDLFLAEFPEDIRQIYNCDACRGFTHHYGSLVTLDKNGVIQSAIWDETTVPELFVEPVKAIREAVVHARVCGVFVSEEKTLGRPESNGFSHMAIVLPADRIYKSRLKTAGQVIAEKQEEFKMLVSGLNDYTPEMLNNALNLLRSDALYRSEKCLGVAEWIKDLHTKRANTRNHYKQANILWYAVATAPEGFCHIKSTMIGTLLDDIANQLPLETVKRRFADKMHPLQYQRPQAAPTSGNIVRAEDVVAKLGIERSLDRRYARLDEIKTIWMPKEEKAETESGIFSHLIPKDHKESTQYNPESVITWRKFEETVLPYAEDIEYFVGSELNNYSAIVTAEYADAPPIIQWDMEEQRNPFSWYLHHGGSRYLQWNLKLGYCKVTGICYQPNMWYGDFHNHNKAVFFILDGAKDVNGKQTSNVLFPEILKSELHEIRSTIEAYSNSRGLNHVEEASACGIRLQQDVNSKYIFRVKTDVGTRIYTIDRWD